MEQRRCSFLDGYARPVFAAGPVGPSGPADVLAYAGMSRRPRVPTTKPAQEY